MQYIISTRISNAQRLLGSMDYNVTEIASIVGYDNPLYFSRLFKNRQEWPHLSIERIYNLTCLFLCTDYA